jgi:hypothetical protein
MKKMFWLFYLLSVNIHGCLDENLETIKLIIHPTNFQKFPNWNSASRAGQGRAAHPHTVPVITSFVPYKQHRTLA